MGFEQKKIATPGLTIYGPQEHTGESRYSWLTKDIRGEFLNVRIEKECGRAPQYDEISPIVSLSFDEEERSLRVGFAMQGSQGSHGRGYFNPYLNSRQGQLPWLTISLDWFSAHEEYEVWTCKGMRGDFITIHERGGGVVKTLMINIGAMGLLEGLTLVNELGRVAVVGDEHEDWKSVGNFVPDSPGELLPFFVMAEVPSQDILVRTWQFARESHLLVADYLAHLGGFYGAPTRFDSINRGRSPEKGPEPPLEEVLRKYREEFERRFPGGRFPRGK